MSAYGRRFRLGLFTLGTATMFVVLLAFVLGNTLRSEQATYYIMFDENVKGMVVGSKVNFQGVPVGSVCDMRFQEGKTRVELAIDPTRATIQDVTQARMDRLLVTGQVTVELEGWAPGRELLPPGSVIVASADPLSTLRGSVPEVVDQAMHVLTRLDTLLVRVELLLGDDNQARVAAILDDVAGAAARLRTETLPAVDALLAEGRAAAQDLRAVAGEGQATLAEARAAVARVAELEPELKTLAQDADRLVREVAALTAGLRAPTQLALQALRQTLDDVRSLARQIELAPDSLLFGIKRPAAPFGGGGR